MGFARLDTSTSTPTSIVFDDIYFSPADGIGESQYHFIGGNDLSQRFSECIQKVPHRDFVIAETGFGTGLNFLLTADLWVTIQKLSNSTQKKPSLHYISTEKYPIDGRELANIYQTQNWESPLTQQIIANYPTHADRKRYDYFFDGNFASIQLTLLIGDATQEIANADFIADAWFLDGFAPRKNPDMWQPALFEAMAVHSKEGTTFATFTAASFVRKSLQEVGFTVSKTKGFGKKRERLIGKYSRMN